jgi:hypothetical protein
MDVERKILRGMLYLCLLGSVFAFLFYKGGRDEIVSNVGAITFVVGLAGLACSASRQP